MKTIFTLLFAASFSIAAEAGTYFLRSGHYLKKDLAPLKNLDWYFPDKGKVIKATPTFLPLKDDPLSEAVVIDARATFIVSSDETKVSSISTFVETAKSAPLLVGHSFNLVGDDYTHPRKFYIVGSIDPNVWPIKIEDYGFSVKSSACATTPAAHYFESETPVKFSWFGYLNADSCPDLIVYYSDAVKCGKELLVFSYINSEGLIDYKTGTTILEKECKK